MICDELYKLKIYQQDWVLRLTGRSHSPRGKMDYGGELQIMLPPDRNNSGEVCLLAESPYRILRVSTLQIYNTMQNNAQIFNEIVCRLYRVDNKPSVPVDHLPGSPGWITPNYFFQLLPYVYFVFLLSWKYLKQNESNNQVTCQEYHHQL